MQHSLRQPMLITEGRETPTSTPQSKATFERGCADQESAMYGK